MCALLRIISQFLLFYIKPIKFIPIFPSKLQISCDFLIKHHKIQEGLLLLCNKIDGE